MNTRQFFVVITLIFLSAIGFSQTIVVTDDASYTTGHASSVLDIKSTTKGLLIPRMTQAQRPSTPAAGLMIYQTDGTPGFYYYNGSIWTTVGGTGSVDGSETKINAGLSIALSGIGTSGNPYIIGHQTQSVTITQRNVLTGLYAGRYIWCNNCGTSGELQIYNGTSWVNMNGGTALFALPTVTTTSESNKKSTTITSGGNVTDAGGGTISVRGVCWSTSSNPTIANNKTSDGTGTGGFTSLVSGLFPSTLYYLRAYATNNAGTSYGNQISFTMNAFAIGDPAQGGVVAYLNGTGGGLIAPTSDQSTGVQWYNGSYIDTWAYGTAITTGDANTSTVVSAQGVGTYAAKICSDLSLNGYSDWFLPSKDEIYQLWTNRVAIGGFQPQWYWSSSETNMSTVWTKIFTASNTQTQYDKSNSYYVRAVREIIAIGNPYGGGIVAYIFLPGDPGYVAGEIHGLVVTNADLIASANWGCQGSAITGADGTAIGTGNQNTIDIMAGCALAGIAARRCGDLVQNGYSDWFLPSKDEFYKAYLNKALLSGTWQNFYWTSSEVSANQAYYMKWSDGTQIAYNKDGSSIAVRAFRTF